MLPKGRLERMLSGVTEFGAGGIVVRGQARKPSRRKPPKANRTSASDVRRVGPSVGADLIFHSGKVYRVDRHRSWAEAVAVKDGRIVGVGNGRAVQKLRGRDT